MSEYIFWQDDSGLYKREEIVRCRDCKHFDNEPDNDIGICDLGLEDTELFSIVEPDGYCKWGERREDG